MAELTEKVVVVTGAANGIGRAVALAIAKKGGQVVAVDMNTDDLENLVSASPAGSEIASFTADVAQGDALSSIAAKTVERFGRLDGWINNAGNTRPAMFLKMQIAEFDSVIGVHVRGTFLGMQAAARTMVELKIPGSILNVASAAGLTGTIGQINYSAAKGAVVSMTKSGAKELGRYGIRVNAVAPSAATQMTEKIRTDPRFSQGYLDRIPLGRWAEPSELAETYCFLIGPHSSYITGQVVSVDGGLYMAS